MDKNKVANLGVVFIFSLTLIVLLLVGVNHQAEASTLAIPTPLSNPVHSEDALNVNFFTTEGVTTDENSGSRQLGVYETLDLQYLIDQDATPNTTTLTLEFSNDPLCVSGTGSSATWSTGINLVAANTADANGMVQMNNFGRCTRIKADSANSLLYTVTVWGVAK